MAFKKHVFMAGLAILYAVVFTATFDALQGGIEIFSIALIALCSWLYGIGIGLLSIPGFLLLNTVLAYLVSGDPGDMLLTYNPPGILLCGIIALSTGSLRKSFEKQKLLQASLAAQITEATTALDRVARQLIEKDEQERIQIGQDLHDGTGQYLTSMLLHCEALSASLKTEGRVEADLAEWMTRRVHNNIRTVRQLSRSLLPIQFSDTDLETALNEMADYFKDVSTTQVRLVCQGDSTRIPASTAQHLYRIVHEVLYKAIYTHKAAALEISLNTRKHRCWIRVKGSGMPEQSPLPADFVSEVMQYRIRICGGQQVLSSSSKGNFRLGCSARISGEDGE